MFFGHEIELNFFSVSKKLIKVYHNQAYWVKA